MREVFARIERVAPTGARSSSWANRAPVKSSSRADCTTAVAAAKGRSYRFTRGPFPRSSWRASYSGTRRGLHGGAQLVRGEIRGGVGGSIFLDEVGTMNMSTQISLLRVLETYRFTRVGANKERDADVRA